MRVFPCFQDGQGVLVAWLVMDYVSASRAERYDRWLNIVKRRPVIW